ncbi:MAG: tetratricopeptide repeat protein [Anaerolineae bacterium]|nr:tetratricopeptide repeat protein [Anaerolineae bacterium]
MDQLFPFLHWTNILIIPGLLLAYMVHELGHALAAYFLGDTSQVERGKITLNPLAHFSWTGFIAFLVFGLGWAGFVAFLMFSLAWPKPLRVNLKNFKRSYFDLCLVAMAGPATSFTFGLVGFLLTLVIAAALVYASGVSTDRVFPYLFRMDSTLPQTLDLQALSIAFTSYVSLTSLWLAFVSLIPLPGQDGFVALISLITFWRERKRGSERRQPEPVIANRPLTLLHQQRRRNSAADIHFKAGADYHEAQQYDDAIARYQQAIRSDQNFGPAYVNLGLAYLAKGNRQRAIQAFRGAAQRADDRKSQETAWQQLHELSEISPVNTETASESMVEMGAVPWTDTKPRPNWLSLGLSSLLLFISAVFLYGYLVSQLIELLRV